MKGSESSMSVIYRHALNDTIRVASTQKCLSTGDVLRIKALLESKAMTKKGAERQHVQTIQQDITECRLKMENLICPKCGSEMKLRNGRSGKFYSCANYPQCRFTIPL